MFFSTPKLANDLYNRYKDIVEGEGISRSVFCAYSSMPVYRTFTFSHLSAQASWSPSESKLSRNIKRFNLSVLNKMLKRSRSFFENSIKKSPENWIFIIDTTDSPNRTENLVDGGLWAKSSGQVFEGRTYVFLSAFNKETKETCIIDFEQCKKIRLEKKSYRDTAWGISLQLLIDLKSRLSLKNPIVTLDSWFDIAELHELLNEHGIKYVIDAKKSRKIFLDKNNKSERVSIVSDFIKDKKNGVNIEKYGVIKSDRTLRKMKFCKMRKDIFIKRNDKLIKKDSSNNDPLKKTNHFLKLNVIQIYNKSNDKECFSVYLSNIDNIKDIELFSITRIRWNIEVVFRNLKQNFMFNKLHLRSNEGADFKVFFSVILYNSILSIKMKQFFHKDTSIFKFLELEAIKEHSLTLERITESKYNYKIRAMCYGNKKRYYQKQCKNYIIEKDGQESQNAA